MSAALLLVLAALQMDVGDCYQQAEAYDHAMMEEHLPPSATGSLEALLNEAVGYCETGDMAEAEAAYLRIQEEYERLQETGPHGVSRGDLDQAMRYWWGTLFSPMVTDIRWMPVTGDQDPDYVAAFLNRDNPDGATYDILIVSRRADTRQLQQAFVSLRVGGDGQYSLCGDDVDMTWQETDEAQRQELLGDASLASPYMLEITDGMCDAIRLFWPAGR
jgi:hypothetical protein